MLSMRRRGLTLVELMVTVAIFALLALAAVPSLSTYVQNGKVRATAESLLNGLQLARSEAVGRNARVRFQLTTSIDSSCTQSVNGTNWVVNADPAADATAVVGACDAAISDTTAPRILQRRAGPDRDNRVAVASTASSLVFNGLGRPVGGAGVTIDVTNPSGGACAADSGPVTCLRILVSPGGQVRMCNPVFPSGDPQACP